MHTDVENKLFWVWVTGLFLYYEINPNPLLWELINCNYSLLRN